MSSRHEQSGSLVVGSMMPHKHDRLFPTFASMVSILCCIPVTQKTWRVENETV